jgi:hypothetical protein
MIYVRQRKGWVEIPKSEIAAVKAKGTGYVVVRLYSGQRYVLNLYSPFWRTFHRVFLELKAALEENQQTRGLWRGAKTYRYL